MVGDNAELAEQLAFLQNSVGAVQGPFDSFLALRGLKTLHLRMRAHCENAQAHGASGWRRIRRSSSVLYPGLPSRIRSTRWRSARWTASAAWSAICVKGGLDERASASASAASCSRSPRVLGGVESLVEHPAIMTHASVPAERRAELGIDERWCGCRSASRTSTT